MFTKNKKKAILLSSQARGSVDATIRNHGSKDFKSRQEQYLRVVDYQVTELLNMCDARGTMYPKTTQASRDNSKSLTRNAVNSRKLITR